MKIAIYQELLPPSMGGQENRSSGLGRTLVARGHTVDVYCVAHAKGLAPLEQVDGVTVHRFPEADGFGQTGPLWRRRQFTAIIRYAVWVRRHASRNGADVHFFMQWPMLHTILRPRAIRNRVILDWCEVQYSGPFQWLQRWLPRLGAINTAVSEAVAEEIERGSGLPTTFLPTGVDAGLGDASGETRSERSVLYLGRISQHKNVPLGIDAYRALVDRGGDVGPLRVAGRGPAEEEVRAHVEALPDAVRSRVEYLGPVSDEEKVRLLRTSSVLVLPSEREGFPVTVVEAMMAGLPVVTVDRPDNGTRPVVQRYGNGIVADATPAKVADAIEAVLDDWAPYSERAQAAGREFTWDAATDQFLALAEALGAPAAAEPVAA